MRFFKFTVLFIPEKDNPDTYNVSVPALPEICTFGNSFEEARFMAQDALELVVLSRLEHAEKVPVDKTLSRYPKNAITEEIVVAVSHQVSATPAQYVKTSLFQSA